MKSLLFVGEINMKSTTDNNINSYVFLNANFPNERNLFSKSYSVKNQWKVTSLETEGTVMANDHEN